MRTNGNRYWSRSARRALLLTCAFVALGAAPATADRYAVPSGGGTTGCDSANPCTLKAAVQGGSNQTIRLTPGRYTVDEPITGFGVTIVGGTSENTFIDGSATLAGGPVLALDNSSTIKNLTIESQNSQDALDLSGSGERIEVYNRVGRAMILRGGSTLETAVVHSSAPNATALRVSGGLASATNVRHSTVAATGAGSTGMDATGLLAGVTVRSSIVNGAGTDIAGTPILGVSLTYSVWRPGRSSNTFTDSTNFDGVAVFDNPGELRFDQDLSSPTINRGTADGMATDLAGRQRQIGPGVDVGAYEAPLPPAATTGAADQVDATSASVEITTNSRTVSTQRWVEYGTDPSSLDQETTRGPAGSMATDVTTSIPLAGLLPGTTYHYRAVAFNTWGRAEGTTRSFSTLELPPTPATAGATGVSASGATLAGSADRGGATTNAWFEWGEDMTYGNTTSLENLGDGPDAVALTAVPLTGLQPNTEYHYRVVAENSKGRRESANATFRTAVRQPAVTVDPASGVSTGGATIAGTVDAGGADTDWRLEYGIGGYDQVAGTGVATGASPQGVSRNLTGLLPGTQYQYRLVADNDAGPATVTGTFTTQVAAPVSHPASAGPVAPRSATIAGRINLGGGSGSWQVEYGTTASYGSVSGPHAHARSLADDDVQAVLQGLEPATTYHYRLVAGNSQGSTDSGDATFTTPADSPAVTAPRAHGISRTAAHIAATVDSGGADTGWRVEYGKTSAYGKATAPETVTAADGSRGVSAKVEGLEPGTKYHFRVVAENSAGAGTGGDKTFTTLAPEPPAPPAKPPTTIDAGDVTEPGTGFLPNREPSTGQKTADGLPAPDPTPPVGQSANAAPAGGTVRVRVPGSDDYVTLTEGAGIPIGSVVDATQGQVTITSAADSRGRTQSANFGGSQFKVLQKRAARPITDIVLTGGATGCTARPLTKAIGGDVFAAERRKYSRRRLWGNGHGRFRTRGRRATATVRGTHWLTEDRCDGTLVRVKRGLVEVRDKVRGKKVMVPAGERYFAKAKLSKREKRALKRKRGRR